MRRSRRLRRGLERQRQRDERHADRNGHRRAPAAATTTISTLTQLYKDVTPGVVDITVTSSTPSGGFGQQGGTSQAEGSGFVWDTEGHIVTNEHVVDGATAISVRFPNGQTAKATLVDSDSSTDIAVIKVDVPAAPSIRSRSARRRTCCRVKRSSRSAARSGSPTA